MRALRFYGARACPERADERKASRKIGSNRAKPSRFRDPTPSGLNLEPGRWRTPTTPPIAAAASRLVTPGHCVALGSWSPSSSRADQTWVALRPSIATLTVAAPPHRSRVSWQCHSRGQ